MGLAGVLPLLLLQGIVNAFLQKVLDIMGVFSILGASREIVVL